MIIWLFGKDVKIIFETINMHFNTFDNYLKYLQTRGISGMWYHPQASILIPQILIKHDDNDDDDDDNDDNNDGDDDHDDNNDD